MTFVGLLFCTVVLYTPHGLLCAIALLWQPILIIISLLSSVTALAPLVVCGLFLRVLQLLGVTSDTTLAAWVLVTHFLLQNITRVAVLHECLLLQRLGWSKGWLLVRSRVPLVALSIAVGAGFAATSLFVSGGALLAEGWTARMTTPGGTAQREAIAATLADLFAPSPSCAQLSRLVHASFQQTFLTCGQVAWTVMLGQAYAAAYPQAVEELERDQESTAEAPRSTNNQGTRGEASQPAEMQHDVVVSDAMRAGRARAARGREELTRLLGEDETYLPLITTAESAEAKQQKVCIAESSRVHARTPEEAAQSTSVVAPAMASAAAGSTAHHREEREAAGAQISTPAAAAGAAGRTDAPYAAKTKDLIAPASTPHSPLVAGLVVESVLAQRQPAALLTGLAALGLHLLYVVLSLSALPLTSAVTPSQGGCSALIPLQCLVTIVSVVWGLWIVHCERHPSAYMRVASTPTPSV